MPFSTLHLRVVVRIAMNRNYRHEKEVCEMPEKLCVVMPVYNEQEAIGPVLEKWDAALKDLGIDYEIRPYNDGSRDGSLAVMREVAGRLGPQIDVRDKPNGGHGNTILTGYRPSEAERLQTCCRKARKRKRKGQAQWRTRQYHSDGLSRGGGGRVRLDIPDRLGRRDGPREVRRAMGAPRRIRLLGRDASGACAAAAAQGDVVRLAVVRPHFLWQVRLGREYALPSDARLGVP